MSRVNWLGLSCRCLYIDVAIARVTAFIADRRNSSKRAFGESKRVELSANLK